MRDIIFRGKRTDNGEWVEGLLYKEFDNFYSKSLFNIQRINKFGIPIAVYEIDPETVGQFTGLVDRNGKRIFEGDIVKKHYANATNADFVELVVFHSGKYCAMGKLQGDRRIYAPLADGVPCVKRVEVIGNIHDNPELLEREAAEQ